jgi:hypothetical protein
MQSWKTKQLSREGLPLFIRYPEKLDLDSLGTQFPTLAVITHHLSKIDPNGVPDADYNDGLFQFDKDIRTAFESSNLGVTVIIETFGGKRHYYIYVVPETDFVHNLSKLEKSYPNERLSWSSHADPEWSFLKKYLKEFLQPEEKT